MKSRHSCWIVNSRQAAGPVSCAFENARAKIFFDMQPEHGGRIELKLADTTTSRVDYAIALATRDAEWSGRASIGVAEGTIEFTGLESGPPAWLVDIARAMLRTVHRNHAANRAWPRRLTRWRPEPPAGAPR